MPLLTLVDADDIDLLDIPQIKDIPGLPGYRACTDGRIWSCKTGIWLKPKVNKKNRYRSVNLYRHMHYVHHLILFTFVGQRPPGMESRHLDNSPGNNALSNLRWGTKEENEQDKIRNGTHESCKTHCPQDHEYTPENTLQGRNASGKPRRICRTCNRNNCREYKRRRKNRDRHTPPDLQES